MDDSEDLQIVESHTFIHEKFWQGSNDIENEKSSKIVVTDLRQLFVGSGSLNEIQNDLNEVNNINGEFNIFKSSIVFFFTSIFSTVFTDKIDTLKCEDEWRYEQSIDSEHSDDKVPYFAESSLGIN